MTAKVGDQFTLSGNGTLSVAVPPVVGVHPIATDLSGVTLNQNADIAATDDFVTLDENWVFQHFRLPANFPRGTKDDEIRIPQLSGLQVEVGVEVDYSFVAALDWRIDYLSATDGWIGLGQGTEVGAPFDGDHVWFDINFDPIDVSGCWEHRFRFGVASREFIGGGPFPTIADYDGKYLTIEDDRFLAVPTVSSAPLLQGRVYPFINNTTPAVLLVEAGSGQITYGVQQGITKIWYSDPNPLAVNDLKAYTLDGVNPVLDGSDEVSFRFRILATAPDTDTDCFDNGYRTVVTTNPPDNLAADTDDLQDAFWLSKPNPSTLGVERLYFDISNGDDPSVIDHMLVDPVTPGVFFHVYYSNDPAPGSDLSSWDNLLWTRVDQTYQLRRRESFTFPAPLVAKYLKVEFTKLQPRYYAPGVLQEPLSYQKHPKWVFDYFLALYERLRLNQHEFASDLTLTYDALNLAFNYFVDDLRQENVTPPIGVESAEGVSQLTDFLNRESIITQNTIDPGTLSRIKTSFQPFLTNPFLSGRLGDILRTYAAPRNDLVNNYSTEQITRGVGDTSFVSSSDRELLVIDKQFPIMSFYLPCRHQYKISQAPFEHDRAYFVGLKELAFTREHYATRFDHPIYVESASDVENVEQNDFDSLNQAWVTYADR